MCLQETKWVGEKAKELDSSCFKFWYTGKVRSKNGLDIIVDKEWKKDIMDVKWIEDQIIALKFVVEQNILMLLGLIHLGWGLKNILKFWEDLEGLIQGIPLRENIFLEGGLDGHVGSGSCNFEGLHGVWVWLWRDKCRG